MKTITILDATTVESGEISFSVLEELGNIKRYSSTQPHQIEERCREAEIVVTNKVVFTEQTFLSLPKLKLIVVCATGTDNVDLQAAKKHGVAVYNVRSYSTDSVAQHTIGLILNLATKTHLYQEEKNRWAQSPIFTRLDYPIIELRGKVLGIVGFGQIGRRVAEIAQALGFTIQLLEREGNSSSSKKENRVPRETFFRSSDFLSLHCPLTEETENLMNEETLSLMKPSSFLINTGRGGLIDETALVEALKKGRIAGAALDVLKQEPPSPEHPLLQLEHPHLLITPHIAWTAWEARKRLIEEIYRNIENYARGNRKNRVA